MTANLPHFCICQRSPKLSQKARIKGLVQLSSLKAVILSIAIIISGQSSSTQIIVGSYLIFSTRSEAKVTLSAIINQSRSFGSNFLMMDARCFLYFSLTVLRCELSFSVLKMSSFFRSKNSPSTPSLSDSIGVELSPPSGTLLLFFLELLFLTFTYFKPFEAFSFLTGLLL